MPSLATVLLDHLSLICVDLETTGLVTATDRIIQSDGIVSERNIVRCTALPTDTVIRARDIPLHQIMSAPVITVLADDCLHVALGQTPGRKCLLILGSGGRDESLLVPAQDHALIFDDLPETATDGEHQAALDWYLGFGKAIANRLDEAGFPYCTGGVMSSSADWCKPLTGWK